jgi:hypothetical protein
MLQENGICVYASVSPLLPCDPQRLVSMLKPHVQRAWVDQMNWIEVNNQPQLLQEYAQFFSSDNYDRVCEQLRGSFRAAFA